MIKRTILCGVEGCKNTYEEKTNEGFPGWGHVAGIMNDETGEAICHICPEHLKEILKILKGE